jgi:hypothetical protein
MVEPLPLVLAAGCVGALYNSADRQPELTAAAWQAARRTSDRCDCHRPVQHRRSCRLLWQRGMWFGARKVQRNESTRNAHRWAGEFMTWLNATWPHPQHAMYNRAAGASNSKFVTTCLGSHLARHTDLLLVDFSIGGSGAPSRRNILRARQQCCRAHRLFFSLGCSAGVHHTLCRLKR